MRSSRPLLRNLSPQPTTCALPGEKRPNLSSGTSGYRQVYSLPLATSTDVKIGLKPHEVERLAECKNEPVKLSRRDIGTAILLRIDGGTTCSAALIFAALAGISVRPNTIFSVTCFNLTFLQVFETGGYIVHLDRDAYVTRTGRITLA